MWAVSLSAGALVGGLTLYDGHLALRYIGATAILLTVATKIVSYDSPQVLPLGF